MGFCSEELWEVLIHPMGDTTMLSATQWGQFAAIALSVLPHFFQSLANILAQLRQILLILKLLVYPDISIVIGDPT